MCPAPYAVPVIMWESGPARRLLCSSSVVGGTGNHVRTPSSSHRLFLCLRVVPLLSSRDPQTAPGLPDREPLPCLHTSDRQVTGLEGEECQKSGEGNCSNLKRTHVKQNQTQQHIPCPSVTKDNPGAVGHAWQEPGVDTVAMSRCYFLSVTADFGGPGGAGDITVFGADGASGWQLIHRQLKGKVLLL